MPPKKKAAKKKPSAKRVPSRKKSSPHRHPATSQSPPVHDAAAVVAELRSLANQKTLDGMSRYAIPSDKAFGVPVGTMRQLAKRLGRSHELAAALWKAGWYEARMLASFVDDPQLVTPAQMDSWCHDFDSWAICDTVCFHLFDRTPHAFRKIRQWADRKPEFEKRAAFALLASVALHDKSADDELFAQCLPLVESAATDERNFVKKSLVWALRSIGERGIALNAAASMVAQRLAATPDATARWIGKTTLRELGSPAAKQRLSKKRRTGST